MNILTQLNWRYAVREFNEDKIPSSTITELVEATRLTASSYGLQPYKLIVVNSSEIKQQLMPYSMGQSKVNACSHLFVLATQLSTTEAMIDQHFAHLETTRKLPKGTTNGFKSHVKDVILNMPADQQAKWAEQQAYIALGNLLTVAAIKQIDACPIGGFEAEGFNKVLKLNSIGLHASVICALGYRSINDESANVAKVRAKKNDFCLTV